MRLSRLNTGIRLDNGTHFANRPGRLRRGAFVCALLSALATLTLGAPGVARAQSAPPAGTNTDALFEKAFGKKKKAEKATTLDLPVKVEGREMGQIPAKVAPDPADTQVDLGRLALLLRDFVQAKALGDLTSQAGTDGYAKISALSQNGPGGGITMTLDPKELTLSVKVPPQLRAVRNLTVVNRANAANGYQVLDPADAAAYVNLRTAQVFLAQPATDSGNYRQPLNLGLDGGGNIDGWSFEWEGEYQEQYGHHFMRGPARLIRDFPEDAVRLQAGDLNYSITGIQTNRPLTGLSIARNYTLQPYRAIQPTGSRDFVLDSPSTVEVLVNGRPTRTFREDAGPVNLSDFPGTSGTNDVQVRITDAFGRVQTIDFPFFFDSELLAAGVSEFNYTVGVPYTTGTDRLTYDRGRPTFSAYHRQGITDDLTLGASLQADKSQQIIGTEVLFVTGLGTIGLNPGASFGASRGASMDVTYRNYTNDEQFYQQRTLTAQGSWRSGGYASLGTTDPRNTVSYDVSARYGQPLDEDLTATLSGRYQLVRDPSQIDGYSVDLGFRRRFGRHATLELTLSRARNTVTREADNSAYMAFRYTFGDGVQSAGFTMDTLSRQREIDWRYQDPWPTNSWNLDVDATNTTGTYQANAAVGYTMDRFEASVRHDYSQRLSTINGPLQNDERTTLNFATGLVFADGHVGVTRPVTNSFALVVPHPRIADEQIGVDPVTGHYLSSSDWLGPPVVPNISAYLVRPLLLDVPDAPMGYDIGNDRPAVVPGNHTGTLVPIGTDATVSLDGVLLDPDGKPVPLAAGMLVRADGKGTKAVNAKDPKSGLEVQFFTNRKGRFRVESVRPGEWLMQLTGVPHKPIPVTVPREAEGLLPLGTLKLEALPGKTITLAPKTAEGARP
ncbi:fimbria/pilus outer membrane usher protein [Azospirillum sp. B4]|uniref:fimbria/pilus outer membrane usher protein n=1 Tax=Azospirillum sp. B4 TaxID=95605 RepID=UPI00034BCED8|nr:fimbria/pilus outer membrane usher protein [Azospirillum sp. B4]